MDLSPALIADCVDRALREDLGDAGDVTTQLSVTRPRRVSAQIVAKADGVLAGVAVARAVFERCDGESSFEAVAEDGQTVRPGDLVANIAGDAAAVLAAERTALNFLQRLSGVATKTRAFVDAVAGTTARILETRKTTPGLRELEKAAVRLGGGDNHRIGLFDQVLLKENHFACALPDDYRTVVARCVAGSDRPVIAEARDLREALAAVDGGAQVVMLDNFPPGEPLAAAIASVRSAAADRGQEIEIEVSGGVTLDTVKSYAVAGVDRISVGGLTHSAPALDLSLLVETAP